MLYSKHKKNSENDDPWSTIYQSGFCNDELTIAINSLRTEAHGLFTEQNETDLQIELAKADESELSVRQAITISYPLLRLLTFLCNQDSNCVMFELSYGEHDVAQLYLNDNFTTNRTPPHMGDYLSISDLHKHLSSILTTWYENHNNYIRMSRLFRQTLADIPWHEEELISAYVRILEMMLDRGEYTLSKEDGQKIKDARDMLKTIDDEDVKRSCLSALGFSKYKGNTEKFSTFLKQKLENHPYHDQLLESLKRAIKIRNAETHLRDFEPTIHREHLLNDLSIELLQALIKLRLLEKLGIPEKECKSLFENHMHFHMHRHNFKHLGKMLVELDQGESQ